MDADALDSAIARHTNSWYTRGCAIGRVVSSLERGTYRDKLVGYMNAPNSEVGHAAIIAAVDETLGIRLRADALLRHRSRSCRCSAEVYE